MNLCYEGNFPVHRNDFFPTFANKTLRCISDSKESYPDRELYKNVMEGEKMYRFYFGVI